MPLQHITEVLHGLLRRLVEPQPRVRVRRHGRVAGPILVLRLMVVLLLLRGRAAGGRAGTDGAAGRWGRQRHRHVLLPELLLGPHVKTLGMLWDVNLLNKHKKASCKTLATPWEAVLWPRWLVDS